MNKDTAAPVRTRPRALDRLAGLLIITAAIVIFVRWIAPPQVPWADTDFDVSLTQLDNLKPEEVNIIEAEPVTSGPSILFDPIEERLGQVCTFGSIENAADPACSLRLGLFVDIENARQLVARLKKAGFHSYMRRIRNHNSPVESADNNERDLMYGIYVGPWFTQDALTAAEQKIRQQTGWNDFVKVTYIVPQPSSE